MIQVHNSKKLSSDRLITNRISFCGFCAAKIKALPTHRPHLLPSIASADSSQWNWEHAISSVSDNSKSRDGLECQLEHLLGQVGMQSVTCCSILHYIILKSYLFLTFLYLIIVTTFHINCPILNIFSSSNYHDLVSHKNTGKLFIEAREWVSSNMDYVTFHIMFSFMFYE